MMTDELYHEMKEMSEDQIFNAMFLDQLTGIWNRRAFDAISSHYKLFAIVDLDSLKWINDNIGHRCGDAVLRQLANFLNANFNNHAFRLSGDEFVVVANNLVDFECLQSDDRTYSFGVGRTISKADLRLRLDKVNRERRGERAARGERPAFYHLISAAINESN